MNKTITIVIVLVVIAAGAYFVWGRGDVQTQTPSNTESGDVVTGDNTTTTAQVKEFKISGSPFKFSMNEIKVKKGDTVRIVFTNVEGVHDWVIDEFNAATKQLKAGESETIEFVADKAGTFEYYCSVGSHRAMGMKGNLIVE